MQNKTAIVVLLAFLIGVGGGYLANDKLLADDNKESKTTENTAHDDGDDHSTPEMAHKMFEVKAENAPTVKLRVTEDEKSGWNVKIDTNNFKFTPEAANEANVSGEGHAHLYVDGEKVARVYGNYFHYDENFDGTKEFKVTLNANDHSEYAIDGKVISATTKITHGH